MFLHATQNSFASDLSIDSMVVFVLFLYFTYAKVYAASVFQDCRKYFLKTDLDSAWHVLNGDYACIGDWASIRAQILFFQEDICFLSNILIFIRKKNTGTHHKDHSRQI